MIRLGEAGETLAATKGLIVWRAREFLPRGENVRLGERVGKNGVARGYSMSGRAGYAGGEMAVGRW